MKRAFTLIELLVVIAIIAILAAILFPVFAQAKLAAKKTQSISNLKQANLGIIMYGADYDDLYPRNDDCVLNSSLNTKYNGLAGGTDPSPWCNGSMAQGTWAFRLNHYAWQKWAQPYIKNVDIFTDPTTPKDAYSWDTLGELNGGLQINLAITGALNTWGKSYPYTNTAALRPSFLGGSQTAVPSVSEAMIMMVGPYNPVVPAYSSLNGANHATAVQWPLAIKEHWYGYFYTQGGSGPCGSSTKLDHAVVPYGNVVVTAYCDGHVKAIAVGDFLAKTPNASEFSAGDTACYAYASSGGNVTSGAYAPDDFRPNTTKEWPFWGLQ